MFGRKETGSGEKIHTLVGHDTQFEGKLMAGGNIRVDGRIAGELNSKGDVIVGQQGLVKANVRGRVVMVAGEIHGDVEALEKLEIAASGKVYGDVRVKALVVEEGGVFRGACQMDFDGKETAPKGGASQGEGPKGEDGGKGGNSMAKGA